MHWQQLASIASRLGFSHQPRKASLKLWLVPWQHILPKSFKAFQSKPNISPTLG